MFTQRHCSDPSKHGFCIIDAVLKTDEVADIRERLLSAAIESERRGMPTHIQGLDPNQHNVRVFNLMDLDPVFLELIQHEVALDVVRHLLGEQFIISNFTANIAKPGADSMAIHSDLAIVLPEPWHAPWSLNIIWCLDDVTPENGATLYLPGSHDIERRAELPEDIRSKMVPFTANAGSVIAMDGRLWHTSGANITKDNERALLFGYYSRSFIRPQWNHNVGLSQSTQAGLSADMKRWLGLDLAANLNAMPDVR